MHYLLYVSAASHPMGEDELMAILKASRARNIADGLTGMLLYKDGSFMQLLEGALDNIQQTYARIGRDTRHNGLIMLRQDQNKARNFPDWSMGFRSVNAAELESMPGFARLGSQSFTSPEFTTKPHIALRLLKTFHTTTG